MGVHFPSGIEPSEVEEAIMPLLGNRTSGPLMPNEGQCTRTVHPNSHLTEI